MSHQNLVLMLAFDCSSAWALHFLEFMWLCTVVWLVFPFHNSPIIRVAFKPSLPSFFLFFFFTLFLFSSSLPRFLGKEVAVFLFLVQFLLFSFFGWVGSLKSGLGACKAETLLLESYLQSILLWLFWR
jgi:hypothetical protein